MNDRRTAFVLITPLMAALALAFLLPLGLTLWRAVANPEFRDAMPRAAHLLRAWDGTGLPPEPVFAALATELPGAQAAQTLGAVTRRLNEERSGMRSLLLATARAAPGMEAPYAAGFATLDPAWADPATWRFLRRAASPMTAAWLLRAVDLAQDDAGHIVAAEALFRPMLLRTLSIAATVTLVCLLLGYPLAWHLTRMRPEHARIVRALILVPFWSSILVRSAAWIALLQRDGAVNAALVGSGLLDVPAQLLFTRGAVLLAMVQVLLPFMVLPLAAVMGRIEPRLMLAATGLGAGPVALFLRVFLPLSLPGVAAGCAIVFTVAAGFYVTPALIGGARDQMVGSFVVFFTNQTINWGMAAALSALLLALVGLVALLSRNALRRIAA